MRAVEQRPAPPRMPNAELKVTLNTSWLRSLLPAGAAVSRCREPGTGGMGAEPRPARGRAHGHGDDCGGDSPRGGAGRARAPAPERVQRQPRAVLAPAVDGEARPRVERPVAAGTVLRAAGAAERVPPRPLLPPAGAGCLQEHLPGPRPVVLRGAEPRRMGTPPGALAQRDQGPPGAGERLVPDRAGAPRTRRGGADLLRHAGRARDELPRQAGRARRRQRGARGPHGRPGPAVASPPRGPRGLDRRRRGDRRPSGRRGGRVARRHSRGSTNAGSSRTPPRWTTRGGSAGRTAPDRRAGPRRGRGRRAELGAAASYRRCRPPPASRGAAPAAGGPQDPAAQR